MGTQTENAPAGGTVAKMSVPTLTAMVVGGMVGAGVFADNWTAYGYGDLGNLNEQVRNTMLITTFVFIGIEGASVYSRYAKKREDVGKATVLGFLSVLSIFALVTLSSYSVVPQPELAATRQPSMALVPYLLAAAYALKLGLTGESYEGVSVGVRRKETIVAGGATAYTIFLFEAAGMTFLLLSTVLLAPAATLYVKARSEYGRRIFSPAEIALFALIVVGAAIGVVGLWTGRITL